ncbi:MAG: UDP-3-O-(3-hydroxymyristoyl)glucosamine N-acyltransferase [Deltaproteobacteria bacterium]|nr:UDP-3-O-(3-hydroxymyristoyl)glucosamine N-acyltransferase [Deltaproteobacteria bacterium]
MRPLPSPELASALAARLGAPLHGTDRELSGVATLAEATSADLAFLEKGEPGNAGVLLARRPLEGRATIVVPSPILALADLLEGWFREAPPGGAIHSSARVHPGAVLHPNVCVGADCEVGEGSVLFPGVVLYARVRIGRNVRVHANAVLGADGFRYEPTALGLRRIPHVGGVVVGDGAEIGANTCIDRGLLGDTVIGAGAKVDNLVQVGHNCVIGPHAVLVSQVGLSGSVQVGAGAILAGQVGVADHRRIGDGARLGARTAVHTDIPAGETWLGEPARPVREAMRVYAALKYLPELVKRLGRDGG